jgi:hypothetical protein
LTVYTPFLRRFTDEKARDLTETVALYREVQRANNATIWSDVDIVDHIHTHCVEGVKQYVALPSHHAILQALDRCQRALIEQEATIISFPEIDWSRAHLSMMEQVKLNRFLRSKQYFLANQERVADRFGDALCGLAAGIISELPPMGGSDDSSFTAPLIHTIAKPNELVDKIIGTITTPELVDVGLFTAVQNQIYENICRYSGVVPYEQSKKPLVTPLEADLSPKELVETYLYRTPFFELLQTPVPFVLPQETRFSGHWIIAPSGRGKTTLLHEMFLDDVQRDASIVVMDSKGEFIDPIKNLAAIRDRLVLIEPSEAHPIALNPLDVPQSEVMHTVALIEYVMAGLLDAKFTALQSNLFRNVIPAIIAALPNPTLDTFRDVLTHGFDPQYLPRLDRRAQEFFRDKDSGFSSKTYRDTRREIVWRLDFLMSNRIFSAIFTAPHTKLDLAREIDLGKIIIINNSKALLTDQGSEFFARFFVALILHAAQQRSGRPREKKLPCFVYIDECQTVIRRDENIATILDECRSQNIALILGHQRTSQLAPEVLSAVSNCAIRMANSDDEAKYLSDKLRMDADELRSLPRGTFATFVRDLTPKGLRLRIDKRDLNSFPKMTAAEWRAVKDRMHAQFSHTPQPDAAGRYLPPPPEVSIRTRKGSAIPSRRAPEHPGDPGEPAPKWGK